MEVSDLFSDSSSEDTAVVTIAVVTHVVTYSSYVHQPNWPCDQLSGISLGQPRMLVCCVLRLWLVKAKPQVFGANGTVVHLLNVVSY